MKNLSLFAIALTVLAFVSCDQSDAENDMEELATSQAVASLDISTEESMESTYDDLDVLTEAGMDMLGVGVESGGRTDGRRRGRDRRDHALDCAEIEKDTVNQIITIDFGDGCEGPHGVVRKGKMIITYSGNRFEAGSFREVVLEDFYLDSVKVEGTRKIEVVSADSTTREVKATMTGGKLIFPDETFATRDADHTRTIVRGEEEGDDYSTLSGGASGVKRDGTSYSVTILEDLMFKRGCWLGRGFIPVSGIKEIVNGETTAVIDYGDGTCDNEIEVTVDGVTTTETIEPRGRRKHRRG
jgi:hypothetical protein